MPGPLAWLYACARLLRLLFCIQGLIASLESSSCHTLQPLSYYVMLQVLLYLIRLADVCGIDLAAAV